MCIRDRPKKEGEPFWASPWSDGRPGWHIECSVMAKKYLGEEIDIHAGGEDLIFPHHENEIAQSEAANGKTFAKYWMHNGFLNINKEKMSKSLGNFLTVRDIAAKFDLSVLRFFMLGAQYRNPINFSDELMESAKNGLDRIKTCVSTLDRLAENASGTLKDSEQNIVAEVNKCKKAFEDAMDDDFNTAFAVAAIFDLVKAANTYANEESSADILKFLADTIVTLCGVLGLDVEPKEELLDSDIEKLIEERIAARKNKNFARADEIRDELEVKGIILEDSRDGVHWKRK